jgi:ABC-type Fe3+/spermidine/putrescine transport system ATPase subunit
LVLKPRVLLLDEPLGALDLKLQMQLVLVDLSQKVEASFVYVTHDQEEALAMSSRIAVLRAGRLEQFGTPQALYHRPKSLLVADFVGENNLLDGLLVERDATSALVEIDGVRITADASALNGARPGGSIVLAMRPESLGLSVAGSDGLRGRVLQAIFSGADWRVAVRTDTGKVVIVNLRGDRGEGLRPGDEVTIELTQGTGMAFDGKDV